MVQGELGLASALKLGLVDEIGGLDAAVALAATVILAMGDGKRAAAAIHASQGGSGPKRWTRNLLTRVNRLSWSLK